jgi:decaprenylphospho-beta-D-erythro-pentofuranosid-2-ulose 2-reductase
MTGETAPTRVHVPPRRTVLILGATSAIARGVASEFAHRDYDLLLAGRELEELEMLASDLRIRHRVNVAARPFDALAFETHRPFFEECQAASGGTLTGVVLCFGYLGEQTTAQTDFGEARRVLDTNLVAAVSILNVTANDLEARRSGFLCALSSVAGDRGRQSVLGFWRLIMLLVRAIPERIFKRMRL